MSAREDILQSIRSRKPSAVPRPPVYARGSSGDFLERFVARASEANTTVHVLDRLEDVPAFAAQLLRERNLAATVHLLPKGELNGLDWGAVDVSDLAPGPDDTAVSFAPYGVAETGTLVYPSSAERPASWHFRPGFEIAVLRTENILADIESAFAKLRGNWPATINLVTGPSRTADIEQTLELGAHGPKALAILLIRTRPTD